MAKKYPIPPARQWEILQQIASVALCHLHVGDILYMYEHGLGWDYVFEKVSSETLNLNGGF